MSDSVGKISLDLEVKSDLEKQISNMSNIIAKKMKSNTEKATAGIFDGIGKQTDNAMNNINNSIKAGLNKTSNTIKSTLINAFSAIKSIDMPKMEFSKAQNTKATSQTSKTTNITRGPPKSNINAEAVKAQIANLTSTLDNVNAQIDLQQSKLVDLKEAYKMAFNPNSKNKIQDQILKTEQRINSLISKSDKLGFKLADLDAVLKTLGEVSSITGEQIESASKKTNKLSSNMKKGRNSTNLFSNALKILGNRTKSTGNNFRNASGGVSMFIKSMFTWGLVFPMVMKGINAIGTGLLNNLKTNQQFATSLAQIQTNLMVAFTPIYQAILPAINSLMSALAKATAYIASFISALFGKTYQQSYQATQQLIDAKEAMGAYGDSAKKAAKEIKGLAAIDEINNLGSTGGDSESGAPTLTPPSLDMSAVDGETVEWAEKFKKILSDLFKPMKQAWDKEGKATINSIKYALSEIWQLIKDIGKSFMEVWTNGTGQKVCENILRVLQTIFKVIGDIAKAFDIAWKNNNLGTKLIQDIFNSLNAVLELLIDIGETFRNVWNSGVGVEICTNIFQILDNIAVIIGQIATSFKNAWDSGLGVQITTDILKLLNGCLKIIQDITASFSKAWESNGDTICEGILLILDDIFGTLGDIANAWANAWENNGNGDALMNSLLELLGKIFTTIGDIGLGMRESLGNVAEDVFGAIINFCTSVNNSLGAITDGFKIIWDNGGKTLFDGIVQLIAQVGELILKLTSGVFADFATLFRDILAPAIGSVFDAIGQVLQKLSEFIEWINSNQSIIDGLKLAVEAFMAAWAVGKVTEFISISGGLVGALVNIAKNLSATAFAQGAYNIASGLGAALTTAWTGVCTIATGVTTALGTAFGFLCSPIGLAIAAIAAVIAIGVLLYKNWDDLKAKAIDLWDSARNKFDWFNNWLGNVFATDWSKKFGFLGEMLNAFLANVKNVFESIKQIFGGIINFISGVFTGNWSRAWQGVVSVFKGIMNGLSAIMKIPLNGVIGLINSAINGLNKISVDIPDFVPGIGGKSFSVNIPKIPYLAKGGIVDSPTLAMVGEAGREAVVPLENNTQGLDLLAEKLMDRLGGAQGVSNNNSSGDLYIELKVGEDKLGDVVIRQFRKLERKTGKSILNI